MIEPSEKLPEAQLYYNSKSGTIWFRVGENSAWEVISYEEGKYHARKPEETFPPNPTLETPV